MECEQTPLEGVLLLKPKIWGDKRGYFVETWQAKRYADLGITQAFVQDNHSMSSKDILRGLHYQKQHPQGKLVYVSLGRVFDVAVDIRPGSKSFGQWFGVELNQDNQWQLWIPAGLAHGFVVLSERAHFHYKCTEFYHPNDEGSIYYNDKDLQITWPITNPILSDKDNKAPSFKDYLQEMHLRANGQPL